MTPLEMAYAAAQAASVPGSLGVVLTIPKGKMPRGFPRGELLNEMVRDGVVERTYSFPPDRVLSFLVRNGLVRAVERDGNILRISAPEEA